MNLEWTTEIIGGKTADVYDPTQSDRPRFGALFLHDLGGATLREWPAYGRWFQARQIGGVCPHGGDCWWTDRIWAAFDGERSAERYLREDLITFFRQRWHLEPRALAVVGFGMGGHGALRLAFKYPNLFDVVAALGAAVDGHDLYGQGTALDDLYDSKEQCRQDSAVLHIHPSRYPAHIFLAVDPHDVRWYRGNDRLHEKLTALGVPHEIDFTTTMQGNLSAYYDRQAERVVRFLSEGLEHESRRLL